MLDEQTKLIVEKVYTEVPMTEGIKDMASFDPAFANTIRNGLISSAEKYITQQFAGRTVANIEHGPLEFYVKQPSNEGFIRGEQPRQCAYIITKVWVPYTSPVEGGSEGPAQIERIPGFRGEIPVGSLHPISSDELREIGELLMGHDMGYSKEQPNGHD